MIKNDSLSNRIGLVEFLRFLFCICIVMMHFNEQWSIRKYGAVITAFLPGSALGVDFFFILSGFLMCNTYEKNIREPLSPCTYICKKIKGLYKEYIIAFFLLFFITFIKQPLKNIPNLLFDYKWEMLMLHMSEIGEKKYINYPSWYISVMLIGLYIAYICKWLNNRAFSYFVTPLVIFIGGGYYMNKYGTLLPWYDYNGLFNIAWIRAMIDICLGCCAFGLFAKSSLSISSKNVSKISLIIALAELVCLARIIYNIIFHKNRRNDSFDILVFACIISLCFINVSKLDKFFDKTFFKFLGKISLIIYLNQAFFQQIYFLKFGASHSFKKGLVISTAITMGGSIALFIFIQALNHFLNFISKKGEH